MNDSSSQSDRVRSLLDSLQPEAVKEVDTAAAWSRFQHKLQTPHRSWLAWLPPARVWTTAAACLLVVVLFTSTSARAWGERLLALMRVQKVAVLPIDVGDGHGMPQAGQLLGHMISDNVVVTKQPGKPVHYDSLGQAVRAAGFAVRTPGSSTAPAAITLTDEIDFHMQLNLGRLQSILEEIGRTDIQIPASADGASIAVHLGRALHLGYGTFDVIETPAPVVTVPQGLPLSALAQAGLQLTGMSATEATEVANSIDWSSTLVIPVPRSHATVRTVDVDGVQGSLIESERTSRRRDFALVWTKGGIVYGVHGTGDPQPALLAVETMN